MKELSRRSLLLLAGAGWCAGACSSPRTGDSPGGNPPSGGPGPSGSAEGTAMQLEVSLYSGRPNPTAGLGEDVAEEFLRRVDALPPAPGAAQPSPGLGYSGLRVRFTSPGRPAEVVVSDGTVVVGEAGGGQRRLADRGRALERWLIDTAAGRLPADAVAAVRSDLPR